MLILESLLAASFTKAYFFFGDKQEFLNPFASFDFTRVEISGRVRNQVVYRMELACVSASMTRHA